MNHRINRTAAIAAAMGLAGAMAAAPALAQETQYQDPAQTTPEPHQSIELTEEKIEQFVDAMTEVREIRDEAAAELERADDTQQAQQVQQDAQIRMIEAVENAGLSVEEYNQIAMMMSSDPELQQRVSSRLEERS